MSQGRLLAQYFDRIYVIHLPERTDRLAGIEHELRTIGADESLFTKVKLGCAPVPVDADGFPSIGVRGCYLSHLEALEDAHKRDLQQILILEDDAIFGRRLLQSQENLIAHLEQSPWGMCHLGHSMKGRVGGLVRLTSQDHFTQLHCYAVHKRALSKLIGELKLIASRPAGDPLGGRMHLDGAFNWFRKLHPQVIVLATFPALSIQRGSTSSLANPRWHHVWLLSPLLSALRSAREAWWRMS